MRSSGAEHKVRCGIVGFGKMGRIRKSAVEKSQLGVVTAIYDPSMVQSSNPVFVQSESEIFESSDLDAIFVCTPNSLIAPYSVQALQSGKHVFAEKPPARSLKEMEQVIDIESRSNGRILMYGFNHRYHDSVIEMSRIVKSGELGSILWMRGRYGKEVDETFFRGWRANYSTSGGGILLDQGIHMIDLLLHLGGEFNEVKSMVTNSFWNIPGIEDNVFALLRNKNSGITASIHSTMTQWRYIFSLEVFLERGALILNGLKTESGSYGDEVLVIKRNSIVNGCRPPDEYKTYSIDNSWNYEVKQFFESITRCRTQSCSGTKEASKVMELIEKIYHNDSFFRAIQGEKL